MAFDGKLYTIGAVKKIKILVDGSCIVCNYEMLHYIRIAPEAFEYVDIAHPNFDATKYGLTKEIVNLELHLIDEQDRKIKGVDAFLEIWRRIPRYRFLATIVGLPGMYQYAKFCYWIFARWIRPWLPKRKVV